MTIAFPRFPLLLLLPILASCASASVMGPRSALLDPTSAAMTAPAPPVYRVQFETTRGNFVLEATREWAPLGADRFYNLVRHGYYDGAYFFRVIRGFVAQFGISADPALTAVWKPRRMMDDPVRESNLRGSLTFAHAGPNTRSAQLFINLVDNQRLDDAFVPFARVIEGMEVVDSLYSGYGDGVGFTPGPNQDLIESEGTPYLQREFPLLDSIRTARILEE